jgi:hypothetical protein
MTMHLHLLRQPRWRTTARARVSIPGGVVSWCRVEKERVRLSMYESPQMLLLVRIEGKINSITSNNQPWLAGWCRSSSCTRPCTCTSSSSSKRTSQEYEYEYYDDANADATGYVDCAWHSLYAMLCRLGVEGCAYIR